MTNTVRARRSILLLSTPPDAIILDVYFGHLVDADALLAAYKQLHIPDEPSDYSRLDAAVASVVLRGIRHQLPFHSEGAPRPRARHRPQCRLHPRALLAVNWADSAPGYSWPVAYYLTEVPQHRAMVLTASADSADSFGYCDVALGHFPSDGDQLSSVKAVFLRHCEQQGHRWSAVLGTGLVDLPTAEAWANELWAEAR